MSISVLTLFGFHRFDIRHRGVAILEWQPEDKYNEVKQVIWHRISAHGFSNHFPNAKQEKE